jgi:hypothetical protein
LPASALGYPFFHWSSEMTSLSGHQTYLSHDFAYRPLVHTIMPVWGMMDSRITIFQIARYNNFNYDYNRILLLFSTISGALFQRQIVLSDIGYLMVAAQASELASADFYKYACYSD